MDRATEAAIDALGAKIKQLERDVEYLLAAVATANARYTALDERNRRQELARSRGVQ